MTWHFDYTIPSLIFLLFFLIYYLLKPVVLTKANRHFLVFICTEVFGFFITFFSSYLDNHAYDYNHIFLFLSNNIYFIFFILRYFIISLFFASILNINVKKDIPTIITTFATFTIIILVILNPIHGLIYNLSPDGKYERTSCFLLVYYANFITLLLDLYYVIRFRKKLDAKSIVSSIFTILALLACSIIDIFYVDYLISDMFFLFVILILYLTFENPDIYFDKKTGLFNIQAFSYSISEYLFSNHKHSVISFVIQNYPEKKQIYGTKQMDLALKEIGKFFLNLFHNKKCFYLQNGKFAIIENSKKDLSDLCNEIINRFEQPWVVNNAELHLNILILDMDNKVSFSDIESISLGFGLAYLEAQKSSSNHITITKKLYDDIVRKTKVTKALDKAIIENSLLVYLQPIVEASTRKIIAAEALVRIKDEELGIIPPIEFISIAEKNGSIEQLGEQVLNKVCIFLKKSNIYEQGIKWINVNLSPVQCQNKKLSQKIDNITDINTIDHKYIHLEITEESMIETPKLKKQMNILITNGYKFSLDDFGSGFSNLSNVKTFPFNNIKLDMSIVREHFNSPDDMLPNIIKTFNSKGLSVTAEGVETKEMADMLEKMGCDFLQGYYFSKPVPTEEFEVLVRKQNSEK